MFLNSFFNFQKPTSSTKYLKTKYPRNFLKNYELITRPINGLLLMMPDRNHLPLLDLSLTGVIVKSEFSMGFRLNQVIDAQLIIQTVIDNSSLKTIIKLPLKLSVFEIALGSIKLNIVSENLDSRVKLDQVIKDEIIFSNLFDIENILNYDSTYKRIFWQGPFDTNFLIEENKKEKTKHLLIEYDGVLISKEGSSIEVRKSNSTTEFQKGYENSWKHVENRKILIGASWKVRLVRLLSEKATFAEKQEFIDLLENL